MDLELWSELRAAVRDVARFVRRHPRDTHPTWLVVLVHLWSVLNERPTSWACQARHWPQRTCPRPVLPDQSTVSRRMRRDDFDPFLMRVVRRLAGRIPPDRLQLLKLFDGKALELPNHTRDPDARWGRGVSRVSVGYKLHAIITPGQPMPHAFAITPLDRCEKQMCLRLIRRVGRAGGTGYLLADTLLNASWLFDGCRQCEHQLVCPRARPETGLGHRYQSPDRLRAIAMLEPPAAHLNDFGPSLYALRRGIEREFSGLTCFGGGLITLPPWVRRIWRVRRWVIGKLLINAARIRLRQQQQAA